MDYRVRENCRAGMEQTGRGRNILRSGLPPVTRVTIGQSMSFRVLQRPGFGSNDLGSMRVLTTTPAASDGPARYHGTPSSSPCPISLASVSLGQRDGVFLQRKSNCACGGDCPPCQQSARLPVSQPHDASEIEAENIADQVMRMSDSRSSGVHLDRSIQSFMQSRLGADLSDVRIHTDGKAANLNRLLNAQAFTVGNDIYFNEGRYQPDSPKGKHLLAHELTHTIQQGRSHAAIQRQPLRDDSFTEDPSWPLLDLFSEETGVPRDRASHLSPSTAPGFWKDQVPLMFSTMSVIHLRGTAQPYRHGRMTRPYGEYLPRAQPG